MYTSSGNGAGGLGAETRQAQASTSVPPVENASKSSIWVAVSEAKSMAYKELL